VPAQWCLLLFSYRERGNIFSVFLRFFFLPGVGAIGFKLKHSKQLKPYGLEKEKGCGGVSQIKYKVDNIRLNHMKLLIFDHFAPLK
jgi:hypothetical protein